MPDFVIIQSGYQVEAQPEPTAAIPIPLRNDAENFQMTNHVLNYYSLLRQLAVGAALSGSQFAAFRLFIWGLRVFVFLVQTLITGIGEQANVFGKRNLCLNIIKSCVLPLAWLVQITFRRSFSMTICVFIVCRFFLPE